MTESLTDQVFMCIFLAGVLGLVTERVLHLGMMQFNHGIEHFETPFNRAMRFAAPIIGLITSGGFLIYMISKFGVNTIFEQMSIIYDKTALFGALGWIVYGLHAITVVLAPVFVLRQLHHFRRRPQYLSPELLLR